MTMQDRESLNKTLNDTEIECFRKLIFTKSIYRRKKKSKWKKEMPRHRYALDITFTMTLFNCGDN